MHLTNKVRIRSTHAIPLMTKFVACSVLLALVASAAAKLIEVDVEDFGASADNATLSSIGINAALKNVSERGGGVVHARAHGGTYRVARIELTSDTELRIGPVTTLYASDKESDWTDRTVEVPPKCGGRGIVQNTTRGGVFFGNGVRSPR